MAMADLERESNRKKHFLDLLAIGKVSGMLH